MEISAVNKKPLLRYRLLFAALSPLLFIRVAFEALKVKDLRYFLQRLGFSYPRFSYPHFSGRPVWIHCASVGEVEAVRPLIDRIQVQLPDAPLLVTTTTPTSAATVLNQGWQNLEHAYLPMDFNWCVKKLLTVTHPRVLLLMETEIWPNVILSTRQQGISVAIINGRLSNRTLNAPDWLKPVYRQVLPELNAVLCKSKTDAEGFIQLGAKAAVVQETGNIKFSIPEYRPETCDITRPFWLAASTHEDEELQLGKAFRCSLLLNKTLLVIAPRHPRRLASIQSAMLECGLSFTVRSRSELPDDDTQVYIADTLGEMNSWLSSAQLVFMGGSLVPVGGHNLLQPAAAGVPIISGPHLDNVVDEAKVLIDAGAMRKVQSASETIKTIEALLADSDELSRMGRAGQEVVARKADVLNQYMDQILPLITH